MMTVGGAKARIAWAADLPLDQAVEMYGQIAPHVGLVKVGLSLFVEHGPRAVERFLALGAQVFLDLKLHDIPNTVQLAAAHAAGLGIRLLTVHASGGPAMLKAAQAGAADGAAGSGHPKPVLLAVTALTSLSDPDLQAVGFGLKSGPLVERLAALAMGAGVEGLVCSAEEAPALSRAHPGAFLCTPGIRPAGAAAGDQRRAQTPAAAIRAGSSLLVVGRPIHEAGDPRAAAQSVEAEIQAALNEIR